MISLFFHLVLGRESAVSTTGVQVLHLVLRHTDASGGSAVSRGAALRLVGVVTKHEQVLRGNGTTLVGRQVGKPGVVTALNLSTLGGFPALHAAIDSLAKGVLEGRTHKKTHAFLDATATGTECQTGDDSTYNEAEEENFQTHLLTKDSYLHIY